MDGLILFEQDAISWVLCDRTPVCVCHTAWGLLYTRLYNLFTKFDYAASVRRWAMDDAWMDLQSYSVPGGDGVEGGRVVQMTFVFLNCKRMMRTVSAFSSTSWTGWQFVILIRVYARNFSEPNPLNGILFDRRSTGARNLVSRVSDE